MDCSIFLMDLLALGEPEYGSCDLSLIQEGFHEDYLLVALSEGFIGR